MNTKQNTIVEAAAAMDRVTTKPLTGMYGEVAIRETADGPCDVNAIHRGMALLGQLAEAGAATSRRKDGQTPFRVSLNGLSYGRTRMRAIVQEEDRLKFYSNGLILPEDMVTHAEPMLSGSGRPYGVRFHTTTAGAMELTTAPGMKPGRRRRPR